MKYTFAVPSEPGTALRLVAPSVLSADFAAFGEAAAQIEASGADWVHLDVMDGQFVPNLTFGPKLVKDLRPHSGKFFDVHLMVKDPDRLADEFIAAGADGVTFHAEAAVHAHRLLASIRQAGAKAGISIVPSTPPAAIEEVLDLADIVLVMTVNPGFGGQELIPRCLDKVRRLAAVRAERGLGYLISVDGGINEKTAAQAYAAGADVLISGSGFFKAADRKAYVDGLRGTGKRE